MSGERRRAARVDFVAGAALKLGGERRAVTVLDLSVRGALVRPEAGAALPAPGTDGLLWLPLGGPDDAASAPLTRVTDTTRQAPPTIRMAVSVRHAEDGEIGLACTGLDLDSATHLRRLIALNLGDPALAERDLQALVSR